MLITVSCTFSALGIDNSLCKAYPRRDIYLKLKMPSSFLNTKYLVTSAVSVLALTVIGGSFSKANALTTLTSTVNTDTLTNLDVSWTGNPIDIGEASIFSIPALTNWGFTSATMTYNGGGTPSDVAMSVRHLTDPHPGDAGGGVLANLNFSFDYLNNNSGSTGLTVSHPGIGHTDQYTLGWNYNAASGGTLNVNLKGVHVPWETDALPVIGSTIAFGAGLFAKRKMDQTKTKTFKLDA